MTQWRPAISASIALLICWSTSPDAQAPPLPTATDFAAADFTAANLDAIAQARPLAGQIQVEASTDLKQALVGQQIVLRVLATGEGPQPPGRLIPPSIEAVDVLLLGEDRWVARNAEATPGQDANDARDSKRERWVFEYRYALFPRSAGRLLIPPLVYSVWRPGRSAPKTLRSEPLAIEVLPAQPPPSETNADRAADRGWLPAKALSLSEAGATSVRLAPGQVIERMLTLKAVGLRAEDLPPIQPSIPFPLQVRADPPRLWNLHGPKGLTGYRTERITLSTSEPGLYQLPAISLDWWNVEARRWEQASTPEWQLEVAAFDSASRRPAPDWRRDGDAGAPSADTARSPTASAPKQPWGLTHWPWVLGGFGLLLLAWTVAWPVVQRYQRSRRGHPSAR
ncbi:MAG: BatD family protein [Lamprobacter sp.]|uniref:BatD family protein n=1 Tax=Lamprobacter sp. TaxID=3100796 RepID=UPI002B25A1FB|nr:BatD family protein [Lamprobacter sp.]MEA3639070.1 BatD family protein [Lamprobacter sp.]